MPSSRKTPGTLEITDDLFQNILPLKIKISRVATMPELHDFAFSRLFGFCTALIPVDKIHKPLYNSPEVSGQVVIPL